MVPKTKYEEDVFINNHTSVWGSFYSKATGKWGYQCCHSCIRNAFCTGIVGRDANDAANDGRIDAFQERKMLETKTLGERNLSGTKTTFTNRNDVYGESSVTTLDEGKVEAALERAKKSSEGTSLDVGGDGSGGKKRGYNSSHQSVDMTVEDMEAYRIQKMRREDPMAALLGSEDLLECEEGSDGRASKGRGR